MKFAIISIPHSGTHFVHHLLGAGRSVDIFEEKHSSLPNIEKVYPAHNYLPAYYEMMSHDGYKIVTPMRHPITTLKSWATRVDNGIYHRILPQYQKYVQPEYLVRLYKNAIFADKLYDIDYIPVDSPNREEFLEKFNRKYNLSLSTHWRPLNASGLDVSNVDSNLVKEVEELMDSNKEFFNKFYK